MGHRSSPPAPCPPIARPAARQSSLNPARRPAQTRPRPAAFPRRLARLPGHGPARRRFAEVIAPRRAYRHPGGACPARRPSAARDLPLPAPGAAPHTTSPRPLPPGPCRSGVRSAPLGANCAGRSTDAELCRRVRLSPSGACCSAATACRNLASCLVVAYDSRHRNGPGSRPERALGSIRLAFTRFAETATVRCRSPRCTPVPRRWSS